MKAPLETNDEPMRAAEHRAGVAAREIPRGGGEVHTLLVAAPARGGSRHTQPPLRTPPPTRAGPAAGRSRDPRPHMVVVMGAPRAAYEAVAGPERAKDPTSGQLACLLTARQAAAQI